jgi:uncharacterized membrane protein
MGKKFTMREVFGFGWNAMKSNFLFFLVLIISSTLVTVAHNKISESVRYFPLTALLVFVVFFVLQTLVSMVFTKVTLQLSNNEAAGSGDFFSFLNSFIDFVFASFLYWLIVIGGLILLIVPGIFWAIKFGQFGYVIVDKGANPIEALKESSRITEGVKWDLLGFYLLSAVITLAGFLCLFVGLLATIPVTAVAQACVYRKISGQSAA